jgi:DNA-binding LacI/PurR family transcriptional regulator
LIFANTTTAKQRLLSYLDFCTERRFDGVIVMGIRLDDPYVHEVTESPLPSVVIDIPLLSKPSLVYEGDFSVESGAAGLEALLSANPDLTAVFFASDLMAIGALRWAQQQGIKVPGDVSIVGFDNIELSEYVTPGLTTIHQRRYEMGVTAANSLVAMLEGDMAQGRVLPPDIVIRGTT